jgi:rod shape-determining protein MreD
MTWFVTIVALIGAVMLQMLAPAPMMLGQAKWPFVMGVVVYYALSRELDVMLIVAFAAGILQDALSPIPLGYSAFSFVAAGWIINYFRNMMLTDSILTMAVTGGLTGLAISVGSYFALFRCGLLATSVPAVILKFAGSAVEGMLCTPLVCVVMSAFDARMGNVEMKGDIDDVD